MKKTCLILFASLFVSAIFPACAQTSITDRIRHRIDNTTDRSEKLSLVFKLVDQAINADTLLNYVLMAEQIVSKTTSKLDIDRIAFARSNYYVRKNYIDSALFIIDKLAADYRNNEKQQKFYLDILFFKAKILDRGNRYTQSLTQLYEVVETAESMNDTLVQIQAKTGIGWVQMEMEQYREALHWLYAAMNTSSDRKFYKNYGALYSNIASAYNSLGQSDSALQYIDIAIKDSRENANLTFLATALSMQAKIFIGHKQPKQAEAPLNEVVEIRKKMNDPFYTVYDMSNLASYYANNNQSEKGIDLCREGIILAKKSGLSSQLLMIYRSLAENYKAAGNTVEYSKTLEAIIGLKDSFNNINSAKLLGDMQAGSEAVKKERTIAEQKINLTRKNSWLIGSALFAVMASMIVWLAFKNYRRKENIKMQLVLAEEKRTAAQSIIDAEEQERKRIAADLHDNIGAYASAIKADVEKITDHGLGKSDASLQNLQQHSQEIINSLRDTIWVLNKDNITITGISDRIKNYVNKLQPTYTNIQFNISEEIENDVRINSQNALNIFRIIQEAIHNALKHSGATAINITIISYEHILIKITDNGKGLEADKASDGNGLRNMKARAREIGMQLSIASKPNKGTELSLETGTTN